MAWRNQQIEAVSVGQLVGFCAYGSGFIFNTDKDIAGLDSAFDGISVAMGSDTVRRPPVQSATSGGEWIENTC